MKKVIKIVAIFICIIFLINTTNTYAGTLGDVLSGGKEFISSASTSGANVDNSKLSEVSSFIYNVLLMISFVVVAVVGIILGMKYMMSSVEEKADVKNSLIVFLIGCIIVYGAFGIWKVIVTFLNTL